MSRLLSYDPLTRTKRVFHHTLGDEDWYIETVVDVEAVVEISKASHAATDERAGWKGDWHHVAQIPLTVLTELQAKGILDDEKAFKRWLNDRDNMVFRMRPGKV